LLAAPGLSNLFCINAIGLLVGTVCGTQTGALMGFEAFRETAYLNAWSGLISLIVRSIGAYQFGMTGAIWGGVLSGLVWFVLNTSLLRKVAGKFGIRLTYRGCSVEMPVLWQFSLPAVSGALLITTAAWGSTALLAHQPNGYAELGIFNAAMQWYYAPLFIPGLVGQVLLPLMAERFGAGDKESAWKSMRLAIIINTVLSIPVLLLTIYSRFIMRSYGQGFEQGWLVCAAVLGAGFILAIQMPAGHVLAAAGRMWTMFVINLAFSLSLIGLSWMLPGRNALTLAEARVASNLILLIVSIAVIRRIFGKRNEVVKEATSAAVAVTT
jgi:O-antigen/teichoic acid export membrane protein